MVDHTVVRLLDQLGMHQDVPSRWSGLPGAPSDD
jgi:3-polyprenyl-4-hydroxybenzoate decarboxylase